MRILWSLVIGFTFALVGKSLWALFAHTHLTDTRSAVITVEKHQQFLKKILPAAIVTFFAWIVLLGVSGLFGHGIAHVAWIPLIVLSVLLGAMAGVSGSLASILGRVFAWEEIQRRIDRLKALLERLRKNFPDLFIILAVIALGVSLACAGGACAVAVDPTVSVNAVDRAHAVEYLGDTLFDMVDTVHCHQLVIVTIGCDTRFAPRTWLRIPDAPAIVDCATAAPPELDGHEGFMKYVAPFANREKADAVTACEREQQTVRQAYAMQQDRFRRTFRSAMVRAAADDCSRITPLIQSLTQDRTFDLVVGLTDLLDNPPADVHAVTIPDGVRVVLLLTRPNPGYGRVEDTLARAAAWERHPGVVAIPVAELTPDFWHTIGAGRTP